MGQWPRFWPQFDPTSIQGRVPWKFWYQPREWFGFARHSDRARCHRASCSWNESLSSIQPQKQWNWDRGVIIVVTLWRWGTVLHAAQRQRQFPCTQSCVLVVPAPFICYCFRRSGSAHDSKWLLACSCEWRGAINSLQVFDGRDSA